MFKYFLELKNRLLLLLFTFLLILLVSYLYKEIILFLVIQPNSFLINIDSKLLYFIFTNVTEIFSVYIQLIKFLCFQISFLYLIYHCFTFLNLAMFQAEYYCFKKFLSFSVFIWICSIFLINFILIPTTWKFFLTFQNVISSKFIQLHFEAKLNEYLIFYILIYYLCVFYCQIFTVLFFFFNFIGNKVKVIKKFRKMYYFFFFFFFFLFILLYIFTLFFIIFLFILIF